MTVPEQSGSGSTAQSKSVGANNAHNVLPEGHYRRVGPGGCTQIVNEVTGRVLRRIPPPKPAWLNEFKA